MGSQPLQDGDYRSRFESFRSFDLQRSALVEVFCHNSHHSEKGLIFNFQSVLARLDAVTAELEAVTKAKERDVSLLMRDLESEKEARRGWQEKGVAMRERLSALVRYPQPNLYFWLNFVEGTSTVCACIDRCRCRYLHCEVTFPLGASIS